MSIDWNLTPRRRTLPSLDDIVETMYYAHCRLLDRSGPLSDFNLMVEIIEKANSEAMSRLKRDCIEWLRKSKDKTPIVEAPKQPDQEPDGYTYPPFQELRPPDDEPPVIRETSSERERRRRREREREFMRPSIGTVDPGPQGLDLSFVGLSEHLDSLSLVPRRVQSGAARYTLHEERTIGGHVTWFTEASLSGSTMHNLRIPVSPMEMILEYSREEMVQFEAMLNRALGHDDVRSNSIMHRHVMNAIVFVRNYLNRLDLAPF